jgi:aconitase B
MINKSFKNFAVGAALVLTTAFAAPAMAGAECTAADKAKIIKSKVGEMRIGDFSKSSTDCLEHFANGLSRTDLVLVAESNSKAWRDLTVEAAKRLEDDGKQVHVFFTNDTDGLNTTANTAIWANGVERGFVPVKIGAPYIIDDIVAAPDKPISMMYKKGAEVWDRFLKVPTVAMN